MRTNSSIAARLAPFLFIAVASGPALALEVGEPAPRFSLSGLDRDKKVELNQFARQLVYVDFWASWCVPCRQSFPWMNQLQAKYKAQGLRVVAVNLDAKRGDAEKFLHDNAADFTIAFDPDGQTPRAYGVKGMPTSLLLDRDGRVLFRHMGFNAGAQGELEEKIRTHLAQAK